MNALASECNSDCDSGWTLYFEQTTTTSNNFLSPNVGGGRSRTRSTCRFSKEKSSSSCLKGKNAVDKNDEDEDEDLSMVSDASSGPPHFHEVDDADPPGYFNYAATANNYFCSAYHHQDSTGKTKILKDQRRRGGGGGGRKDQQLAAPNSFLDDTASSPAFNFSKKNFGMVKKQASMEAVMEFSQGFSATHFGGRSAYQDHLGGCTRPSLPDNNQWF